MSTKKIRDGAGFLSSSIHSRYNVRLQVYKQNEAVLVYLLVVSLFVLCIPEPCFAEKGKGQHAQAWLTDICPQYFNPVSPPLKGQLSCYCKRSGWSSTQTEEVGGLERRGNRRAIFRIWDYDWRASDVETWSKLKSGTFASHSKCRELAFCHTCSSTQLPNQD